MTPSTYIRLIDIYVLKFHYPVPSSLPLNLPCKRIVIVPHRVFVLDTGLPGEREVLSPVVALHPHQPSLGDWLPVPQFLAVSQHVDGFSVGNVVLYFDVHQDVLGQNHCI